MFQIQFCTNTYTRHHTPGLPKKLAELQQLASEKEKTVFNTAIRHASPMLAYFDSHGAFSLLINRDVVRDLIGGILVNVDGKSVHSTCFWALQGFKDYVDVFPKETLNFYHVKMWPDCSFKTELDLWQRVSRLDSISICRCWKRVRQDQSPERLQ